jgi:Phosphotransferase enzyme family
MATVSTDKTRARLGGVQDDPTDALRRLGLDPSDLSVEGLAHNRWLTDGIWRVSSSQQQMVLKRLAPESAPPATAWDTHWTSGARDPRRWNYWAREGLAYRHRLVDVFEPAGIGAPRVIAADYRDDAIVLLLEFVDGRPGEHWEVADYAAAAQMLGRAHGRLLTGVPTPDHAWLSRGFLRQYSSDKPVDWGLLDSDEAWAQPLVRRNFPPELRDAATWLHSSRARLYEIAEALPRVLSHLDFWTKNLIMRSDGRVVLLDWAFAGDGAVGEDVGNLVPDAAFDHFVPAASLPDLEAAALTAYIDGLAAAGWSGDPRIVELGMCASAVKYDWLTPAMLAAASAPRQLRYGGTEEIDADHRFRERGVALLDNAQRARRAVVLADTVDLRGGPDL